MVTIVTTFSIWNAFSNCRFCTIQLVAHKLGPDDLLRLRTHLRGQIQVVQLQLDLVH